MGKLPCIETDQGYLSETNAILEYLEDTQPSPPLLPADPFARAKVREIMKVLELYIELAARRHYGEIFFGAPRSQAAFDEVRPVLENGLKALKQLGTFTPYIAGVEFTAADIMAAYSFCYAAPVAQAIYGWDIIAEVPGLQGALDATHAREVGAKIASEHQAAVAFKRRSNRGQLSDEITAGPRR
ncbi:MAG: glutathione S-transferase C-terminal domain-containing protein [Rhodospirillales bacterium]|nr:glutathione S-transferase C-terminal domain-containing protein [Rhodospirillales bacterium]